MNFELSLSLVDVTVDARFTKGYTNTWKHIWASSVAGRYHPRAISACCACDKFINFGIARNN